MSRATGGREGSYAYGASLDEDQGIGSLTLGGYLREITQRFGPREAAVLRMPDHIERWTYDDLWSRSVQVARGLIACGVSKGTRVGILMTNRLEFLSSVFGTALAGGVATAINTFFTASELDEALRISSCSILLFERSVLKKDFLSLLLELEPLIGTSRPHGLMSLRYPSLRHLAAIGIDEDVGAIEPWPAFLAKGEPVRPEMVDARAADVAPSDPGVLFFSSGSTGKAKGILSAHRGPCLQLWRWPQWYCFDDPPRVWSSNGFFFSGNFCQAFGSALTTGGSLVLQRWFDAEEALRLMETERASMLLAWPHQWAQLEAAPNYATADLGTMRYVDARTPIAHHPTVSTSWHEPRHAYGCTETFTLISVLPGNASDEQVGQSHGVPTSGSTIKITEPLTGKVVALGERGEIAVKGPTLMLGYVGTPLDDTLDDEGFYKTGDGGSIDAQGRLHWEGRLNDIIKTGGANVSPLEIDAVIRDLPGVKVAQTIGVPDDLLGEMVVTCIVAHDGFALSETIIREGARMALASYKVPRRVLFFSDDDIETTGSAKIKTAHLRQIAAERLSQDKS
jgi:fatty-acyl-CoA synthase